MSKISLQNMIFGFFLIFCAASGGAFVSINMSENYISGISSSKWSYVLQASSHGHTSLFGIIHILFGLTLPYSALNRLTKIAQSIGLGAGAVAMGPFMIYRSMKGPSSSFEWEGMMIGILLSMALGAIAIHMFGLLNATCKHG